MYILSTHTFLWILLLQYLCAVYSFVNVNCYHLIIKIINIITYRAVPCHIFSYNFRYFAFHAALRPFRVRVDRQVFREMTFSAACNR